jgi:hypothetical protein
MKSAIVFLLYFAEMLIWITIWILFAHLCDNRHWSGGTSMLVGLLLFELVLQPLESYRKSLASSIIEKMENR